jgi:hypothetical protein
MQYTGTLSDINCQPMKCTITVPLLEQYGWIYSDKVKTTCIVPDVPGYSSSSGACDEASSNCTANENGTSSNNSTGPTYQPLENEFVLAINV